VLTDWVELPSQLYEHWLERPEILSRFAVHSRTGQAIPDDLMKRLHRGAHLQPGLRHGRIRGLRAGRSRSHLQPSVETSTSTLRGDGAGAHRHAGRDRDAASPDAFRPLFSGGGYASAYYSYMWSEVLDADAFAAFEETGNIFDPQTAKSCYDTSMRRRSRDPEALYKAFRGRLPTPEALLKRRGLAAVPS
jgi:peptidyl-dipeptidase Dcp